MKIKVSDLSKENFISIPESDVAGILEFRNRFFLVYSIEKDELFVSDLYFSNNQLSILLESGLTKKARRLKKE